MTQKLEEARKLYQTANADQRYVLESLFPELKESEGERIRKEIIEHIIWSEDNQNCAKEEMTRWVAWLEKQGEQKPYGQRDWSKHIKYEPNSPSIIEQKQVIDYPDNLPKDNWELVHEFIEKFGRIPEDEDELNALVEYVLKKQKPI